MSDSAKRCPACEKLKPRASFNANRTNADGLQSRCRACDRAARKQAPVFIGPIQPTKQCAVCAKVKPSSDFRRKRKSPTGLQQACHECAAQLASEAHQRRREREAQAAAGSGEITCGLCNETKPAVRFRLRRSSRLSPICGTCLRKERQEEVRLGVQATHRRCRRCWVLWTVEEHGQAKSCKVCSKDLRLRHKYGLSLERVRALLSEQGWACAACLAPIDEESACVDHCHEEQEHEGRVVVRGILCQPCNKAEGFLRDPESAALLAAYMLNASTSLRFGVQKPSQADVEAALASVARSALARVRGGAQAGTEDTPGDKRQEGSGSENRPIAPSQARQKRSGSFTGSC